MLAELEAMKNFLDSAPSVKDQYNEVVASLESWQPESTEDIAKMYFAKGYTRGVEFATAAFETRNKDR